MDALNIARELVNTFPISDKLHQLGQSQFTFYDGLTTYYVNPSHYQNTNENLLKNMTANILADSLGCYIDLEQVKVKTEKDIPVGASKVKGCPDMPDSMVWPPNLYFLAQLNCAEVSKIDNTGFFPDTGMVYFFANSNVDDYAMQYYDGPVSDLKRRNLPPADKFDDSQYYYKEFKDNFRSLKMKPVFVFNVDSGLNQEFVSAELIEQLERILKAGFSDQCSSFSVFGRPQYWQGEDEDGHLMYVGDSRDIDEFLNALIDQGVATAEVLDELFKEVGWFSYMTELLPHLLQRELVSQDLHDELMAEYTPKNANRHATKFMYQDDFGDCSIHFWVEPDSFQKKDFSNCRTTNSGT